MKKYCGTITVMLTLLVIAAPCIIAAEEEEHKTRFGFRAGVGIDPDQGMVGIQALLSEVFKPVRFMPSVDVGFGDDVTLVAANADLRLQPLSPPEAEAGFYLSAGPTVQYKDPEGHDSDVDIGLSLNAGLQFRMGQDNYYNLEGRYGIDNVQDYRILFGVLF